MRASWWVNCQTVVRWMRWILRIRRFRPVFGIVPVLLQRESINPKGGTRLASDGPLALKSHVHACGDPDWCIRIRTEVPGYRPLTATRSGMPNGATA